MDSRWFKEDRELPISERAKAKEETEKALKASTVLSRRLTRILKDEVEKTYTKEENYTEADWDRVVFGLFQRRKTLNEIINLLPYKED
jgi:hypothetical protein